MKLVLLGLHQIKSGLKKYSKLFILYFLFYFCRIKTDKPLPNDYDKILRENLDALLPFIAQKLLGLDLSRTETLKDKIQVTLEREGDLLHDDSE